MSKTYMLLKFQFGTTGKNYSKLLLLNRTKLHLEQIMTFRYHFLKDPSTKIADILTLALRVSVIYVIKFGYDTTSTRQNYIF